MKTRSDALPRVGAGLRAYGWYNDGKRNSQGRARGRQAPPCPAAAAPSGGRISPPRQARSQRVCEERKTLPSTNNIGSLPIAFSLTTGTAQMISVDLTNQANVFYGFCRDVTSTLTNCFEGAKDGACPQPQHTRRPLDIGWTREEEPREGTPTTRCCQSLFSPDFRSVSRPLRVLRPAGQ